jgi:hypothetical protein
MDPHTTSFLASLRRGVLMIYDDDTGRRAEFEIRTEDYSYDQSADRAEQVHLPTPQVQDEIIALARQPGWGVERIFAQLRRSRHDISRATIRHIITRADTHRLDEDR